LVAGFFFTCACYPSGRERRQNDLAAAIEGSCMTVGKKRVARDARAMGRAGTGLARIAADNGQAALAALSVLSRRGELLRAATEDPMRADHAEMFRMSSEKIEALGLAGLAIVEAAGKAQRAWLRYWQAEMSQAVRIADRLFSCATADRAARVQADAAAAAVQRLASLSAVLTELATASTAAALMPYHNRVTGNARRLARAARV
jgi:hypothetical protein